jgi:putative tryptophan/tyrosine transport system substrate-binding protein
MNTRQSLLVFIGITILGIILYYCLQKRTSTQTSTRIAIFEPASHPAIDEIVDGFITGIKNDGLDNYTFDRYNANGNKTLLRSQAEEIIHRNYDLIMTIGADPTRTLHELTTKKKITTPIVFDAVSDPVGLGVVASLASSDNNITGVEEVPDYKDQIEKLLLIKPTTKNILLVYDPIIKAGIHEIWAQDIKKITDAKHITLTCAKVFHSNEIQTKVQPLMTTTDVIMILTDHTTVSGIDSLITLCNRYNVTLYASDLNSGDKGAALAYGVTQYDLGVDAATLALKILDEHILPTNIPIISPKTKKLKINRATMNKQNVIISRPEQEKEIKKVGGIFI